MRVEELVPGITTRQRVARRTEDRNIAVAGKDAVIAAGILDTVVAVSRGEDAAIGGYDRQALIAGGGRKAASAAGVDDDFEIEVPGNRCRHVIGIRRHTEVDDLIARENVVIAAGYERHAHPPQKPNNETARPRTLSDSHKSVKRPSGTGANSRLRRSRSTRRSNRPRHVLLRPVPLD